jgi:hypothetical protein
MYKYLLIFIFIYIQYKEDSFSHWANTGEGWENDSLFFTIHIIVYIYYVYKYTFINIYLHLCLFIYSIKKTSFLFGQIQGRVGKMTVYFSVILFIQ